MKKKIGFIIKFFLAILIVFLLVWRFWSQSFSDIITVDKNSITSFSSSVMIHRLENGQIPTDTYRVVSTEEPGNEPKDILEILASTKYRPDFRNLLPWKTDSIESDKNYDGRTAVFVFSTGDQKDEWLEIYYLSHSIMTVSVGGTDKLNIYHPTNHKTLDELIEYIKSHNNEQ